MLLNSKRIKMFTTKTTTNIERLRKTINAYKRRVNCKRFNGNDGNKIVLLLLFLYTMMMILMLNGCVAKIALMPHTNHSEQTFYYNATITTTTATTTMMMLKTPGIHCSSSQLTAARAIDEVAALKLPLDAVLHVPLLESSTNRIWKQRLLLHLNFTTPLEIKFSQHVERQIYFNRTTRLLLATRAQQNKQHYSVVLPCALRGDYDIMLMQSASRNRSGIDVETHIIHPKTHWTQHSHVHRVNIRNQNRVRKRELIIKWDRSNFDSYAVQYCLVFNMKRHYKHFCTAVEDSLARQDCIVNSPMDYIWLQPPHRVKKINPYQTNIICTGSRTQQVLKGLAPNMTYFVDIFGVHTRRHNQTFHMASTMVHYKRRHPQRMQADVLSMLKISELQGTQVFSYKVPTVSKNNALMKSDLVALRYLILPCGGSEIDVKLLKRRKLVDSVFGIYRPTYIELPALRGERYIIRFSPSNADEVLKANKVALAVTTSAVFSQLAELPENITVIEVRSGCKSTTIAWYHSPDNRHINYCIIVFNMSVRNRSFVDNTNYCMDFGKPVIKHADFHSISCIERSANFAASSLETYTIFNLLRGESYLIYVTANLNKGRALPYQSLRVRIPAHCTTTEMGDQREQNSYY